MFLPIQDIQAVEINPKESVIIPTVLNRPSIKLNLKIHLKNTSQLLYLVQ
ncbi:hypothetical protein D929_00112 [Enterococcus faecalis 02-MB-P-10]|nr:hypothetical protein D929_00112 [Enterococcus faecalis 02-MB-P-10]